MTRIITVDGIGKERTQLIRAIVAALRELARQNGPGVEALDLVSFIILSLETIAKSIDVSVVAWEKRDYWVKADRFRMDWAWAGNTAIKLRSYLIKEDWGSIAGLSAFIGQKLAKTKVSDKNRIGTPWKGCRLRMKEHINDKNNRKENNISVQ